MTMSTHINQAGLKLTNTVFLTEGKLVENQYMYTQRLNHCSWNLTKSQDAGSKKSPTILWSASLRILLKYYLKQIKNCSRNQTQ